MTIRIPRRYRRLDGWRGYWIPGTAVAGASDTGWDSNSPAPTFAVKCEIRAFQREVLQPAGIKSRTRIGESSNIFCCKRWVCVSPTDYDRAAALAEEWLKEKQWNLDYLHGAK